MSSISAIIPTKNEERNIAECIKVLDFCNEILIIDDNSTDNTRELARSLGARVFLRDLKSDFASQRNFGLQKAKEQWILFVDADERVGESLRNEIVQLTNNPAINYSGFQIKREDVLWGKRLKHSEFGKTKLLRLARRNTGIWRRRVHEYWDVKGRIGTLKYSLLHFPHPSLREFISDINWQSTLHAEENLKEGKRPNIFTIILFPKLKFLDNWIIKGGFLDGTEGFIAALIMSFHSFLAWSKLWTKK